MGPELEHETRLDGNKALVVKESGGLSVDTKDESVKCGSNCEGNALSMDKSIDQPILRDENQDVEVKDIELPSTGGKGRVNAGCQDSTESSSSSSFDDTASETEDATSTVDGEVGSNLFTDGSPILDIKAFGDLLRLRKKKLTSHWRTFVHPLMWRCKWAELQVKKLHDLAIKYDRKLVDNKRNSPAEGFDLKSAQFPGENPTDKLMKRKKRRRVEDTMDPSSYLSDHPVLSYFDNKNRTSDDPLDDHLGNQEKIKGVDQSEVHGERLWLESGGGDNFLEELLRKIGLLQTQARDLKCRLGKVMTENTGLFTRTNDTGMAVPANLTISAQFPAAPQNNGDRMAVGSSKDPSQLTSVYTSGSMVMPKVAVPSHAEGSYISNVIQGSNQSLQRSALMKVSVSSMFTGIGYHEILLQWLEFLSFIIIIIIIFFFWRGGGVFRCYSNP
ncbi:OLC1v1038546C1 [Oldenlandia corymbosa var. corymbosa]|uniref:OLC1v1038546C1 n=1 Tax=Oldenlandia corymbosa var. corymbosa TaxID=529605 RepID=A0AAV1D2C7_OLDCO|nr:OLC1v1038546C1 [Oldenlandia corymbosa var. corymbosa]